MFSVSDSLFWVFSEITTPIFLAKTEFCLFLFSLIGNSLLKYFLNNALHLISNAFVEISPILWVSL